MLAACVTWVGMVQSLITAGAGLLGVLTGGWIARGQQRWERKQEHIREQLRDFYSPILGMRAEIRAKSELRLKISSIAGAEWHELFERHTGPEVKRNIVEQNSTQFDKIQEYNNKQRAEEIIPLYRKMLSHFTKRMWLAEPSTLLYYDALNEFVEICNRADSLPTKVIEAIEQKETKLYPLYKDLQDHFDRLSRELGK